MELNKNKIFCQSLYRVVQKSHHGKIVQIGINKVLKITVIIESFINKLIKYVVMYSIMLEPRILKLLEKEIEKSRAYRFFQIYYHQRNKYQIAVHHILGPTQ